MTDTASKPCQHCGTTSAPGQSGHHSTCPEAPRVVAECWTCCGLSGYRPLPLFNAFNRPEVTQTPAWHRIAGHDVREVKS